ncbi:MAG: hypothetical protein WC413_02340 [Candidatus Nanoarchaeia archaeon]
MKNKQGAWESYKLSWGKLWKYFWILLLISFINLLLTIPGNIPYAGIIYGILICGPLAYGLNYVKLKVIKGTKPKINDLFEAFKNYGDAVIAYLLSALIVIGGLILLIIPGIIFALKLSFVSYLIVDKKMRAIPAIKKSWNMTKGYTWTIFLIYLQGIFVVLAGLICLVVGVIPAIMLVGLAHASLYNSIK